MSVLHIYQTLGNYENKVANGTGELSSTGEFSVTLTTNGKVSKGTVYVIKKGKSNYGDSYNCLSGASQKGDVATFQKTTEADVTMIKNPDIYGATYSLQSALSDSTKTVIIKIADEDLENLKKNDYKLCFAKKISEEDYNVVWQSYTEYLSTNTFSWTPQYQLFGTNLYKENITVQVSTNIVNIGLGEESTLDEVGHLGSVESGGADLAITMINDYGTIHPGLNQISTGIDGTQVQSPIYVAENASVEGSVSMTPVEKVLVWFEQDIATATMFSTARSLSVEIDLTTSSEEERTYQDQEWGKTEIRVK